MLEEALEWLIGTVRKCLSLVIFSKRLEKFVMSFLKSTTDRLTFPLSLADTS